MGMCTVICISSSASWCGVIILIKCPMHGKDSVLTCCITDVI